MAQADSVGFHGSGRGLWLSSACGGPGSTYLEELPITGLVTLPVSVVTFIRPVKESIARVARRVISSSEVL